MGNEDFLWKDDVPEVTGIRNITSCDMNLALIQSRQRPKFLCHARFHRQQGRAGQRTRFTHCYLKDLQRQPRSWLRKAVGSSSSPRNPALGGRVRAVRTPVLQTYERSLCQVSLLRSTGICSWNSGSCTKDQGTTFSPQQRPRDWIKVYHQIFGHKLAREMLWKIQFLSTFEFHYVKKKSALMTKHFEISLA